MRAADWNPPASCCHLTQKGVGWIKKGSFLLTGGTTQGCLQLPMAKFSLSMCTSLPRKYWHRTLHSLLFCIFKLQDQGESKYFFVINQLHWKAINPSCTYIFIEHLLCARHCHRCSYRTCSDREPRVIGWELFFLRINDYKMNHTDLNKGINFQKGVGGGRQRKKVHNQGSDFKIHEIAYLYFSSCYFQSLWIHVRQIQDRKINPV